MKNTGDNKVEDCLLQVADLTLNMRTAVVHRAGKEITLSMTEYKLLLMLMVNADTILTRKDITTEIWRSTPKQTGNNVEVYISYLRNKIDRGHRQKLITTIRGSEAGYLISTSDVQTKITRTARVSV